MRPLTFSDEKDYEQTWTPGTALGAAEAFWEFVEERRGEGNQSFTIGDEVNGEVLVLMFSLGVIARANEAQGEYRLATNQGDYRTLVANFVRGGFAWIDSGQWWPDVPSVARARLRFEFDGSVLRRTHPRELRRRLEVLTRIDGREPTTRDGVTQYGFGNGGGDTVNAWFTEAGRGLLLTFDHYSDLNFYEDPEAQIGLYDGVPADLLALVSDQPETDTTLNVSLPTGGTVVAASGIFQFSGPCAMSDGLVAHLQESQTDLDETGVEWLVEAFLSLPEFTPEEVAETVSWWDADQVADGFASTPALPESEPLDPREVERFCRLWADSGANDRWSVHYVLFEGHDLEDADDDREELFRLVDSLGLDRVDPPIGAASGEVWVRAHPAIDDELENWA